MEERRDGKGKKGPKRRGGGKKRKTDRQAVERTEGRKEKRDRTVVFKPDTYMRQILLKLRSVFCDDILKERRRCPEANTLNSESEGCGFDFTVTFSIPPTIFT